MRIAAIVIDDWKLPIFKTHLDKAGFNYTVGVGITDDSLILTVDYNFVADLNPVVLAANKECNNVNKQSDGNYH